MRSKILLAILLISFLSFSFIAHRNQLNGLDIKDIRIQANGKELDAIYAKPEGEFSPNSLPGVVVFHGFSASKEMMRPFVEGLSRRGFGVIAVDQQGHGLSEGNLGEFGSNSLKLDGVEVVSYLRSIPEIDSTRVALLGHSMGGSTAIQTSTFLGNIDATVIIGNSLSDNRVNLELNTTFPRNVFMGMGKYDELFSIEDSIDTMRQMVEGIPEIDTLYGEFGLGTARKLSVAPTDHIFEVSSPKIVEESIDWIYQSLVVSQNMSSMVEYEIPNGGKLVMDQFLTLIAGILLILTIPVVHTINQQPNITSSRKVNWIKHGLTSIIAFIFGGALTIISPRSFVLMFMGWFILGSVFYAFNIKSDNQDIAEVLKDCFKMEKEQILISIILLGGIMGIIHLILIFVYFDYRLVLPLFSALSIRRLGLFLLLFIGGLLFFTIEIKALGGELKLNTKHYLFEVGARIWPFVVILIVHYIPILMFQQSILPTLVGFLAFFLIGFIPVIIIISLITFVGRNNGYSNFSLAIVSSGLIAWILASTLPFVG